MGKKIVIGRSKVRTAFCDCGWTKQGTKEEIDEWILKHRAYRHPGQDQVLFSEAREIASIRVKGV